jgi:hypothetical protein
LAQYTVYPAAISDTYLHPQAIGTNYASSTLLYLPANAIDHVAIFKFDIASAIPVRKRIVSASLTLNGGAAFIHMGVSVDHSNPDTVTYATRGLYEFTDDPDWFGDASFCTVTEAVKKIYQTGSGSIALEKRDKAEKSSTAATYIPVASKEGSAAQRPVLKVVYEDAIPFAPTRCTPAFELRQRDEGIRFSWQYNDDVDGSQAAFDLQWSSNGGTSWTTISQTTTNQYSDIAANTLPNGTITWRVRVQSADGDISPYTEYNTFECAGAPSAPTVSCTTAARPVVSWTGAAGQVAYQVQVLAGATVVHDSGEVSGTGSSFSVPEFIPDAAYTMQVRVKNRYGIWSAYGSLAKTISTTKPTAVNCTAVAIVNGIRITPGSLAGLDKAVLYRKRASETAFIPIAIISGTFDDYTVAHGETATYFVRAILGAGYRDGSTAAAQCAIGAECLAPIGDFAAIVELDTSEAPYAGKTEANTLLGAAYRFDGRMFPVWEYSGQAESTITGTYLITRANAAALSSLITRMEPVCFRDRTGRRMFGVITSNPIADNPLGLSTVQVTVQRTDFNEKVVV